jgi:3-hydroxy-D-aspartate aldolase
LIDEGADLHLEPGSQIRLLPSHGDTTINLHEEYVVLRNGEAETTWPIAARGKFR